MTNETNNTFSDDQLRKLVETIESLEQEKAETASYIKEAYDEAKAFGFDVKILRKVIALRRKGTAQNEEEAALTAIYMDSLKVTSGAAE